MRTVNWVFMLTCSMVLLARVPAVLGEEEHAADTPKTLAEALAHMEKVLGAYNPDEQLEWRVPMKYEKTRRPVPSQPKIVMVFDGISTIGLPFRTPVSISFDETMQWEREVYDLAEGGEKTLTHRQRSHNVTRYTISRVSDVWLVNGTMLSNGVHGAIGKPAFLGTVKWHPDGFEFVGHGSPARYYASGGEFILGMSQRSVRYIRRGNRLVIKQRGQPYHLAKDDEGHVLMIPDLDRPFGEPFIQEYRSEPLE